MASAGHWPAPHLQRSLTVAALSASAGHWPAPRLQRSLTVAALSASAGHWPAPHLQCSLTVAARKGIALTGAALKGTALTGAALAGLALAVADLIVRASSFVARRRLAFTLTFVARLASTLTFMALVSAAVARAQSRDVPVDDAHVNAAVERAVAWLLSQRNARGDWEPNISPDDQYWAGHTGLALLALLYAGQDARQTEMAKALEWLAGQRLHATYTYGVRAHALALVPGAGFRNRIQDDLRWLIRAAHGRSGLHPGAFDYRAADTNHTRYDNSNTQFGVLGAWMATEHGVQAENLRPFWQNVEKHWLEDQAEDGGWGYQSGPPTTGSMTAAGLASLYVVLDRLHASTGHKRATDLLAAIERGLDWFGQRFTPENPGGDHRWKHYYLYGVERVGRASGRKYFRGVDWFRVGAADVLREQRANGSWDNDLPSTCFALMFLCHGRAPLLFNKLQHGEAWDEYLRDVSTLTRYAEHAFERLLNWQIVTLDGSIDDLMEAPVLYLSGREAWDFDELAELRLREYCRRGGLIFAVTLKDGRAFERSIRDLAQRLFPEQPLRPLKPGHPVFSLQFAIDEPPEMSQVHNGLRTLLLLCGEDVASAWNEHELPRRKQDFELGCNAYLYATDKTTVRTRLQTPAIPVAEVDIRRTLPVARVRHGGDWDPEPYGWTRLKAHLNNAAATRLVTQAGIALDAPELKNFRIAYVTGTRPFELSGAEVAGLRAFLTNGGTLVADAAGGSRRFLESFEAALEDMLGAEPVRVSARSAIISGAGVPDAVALSEAQYRRAIRGAALVRATPPLKAFLFGRRVAVLYSPLDVTAGLLGTQVYGCRGYAPESALDVARNMLLFADLSTAQKIEMAP